MRAKATALVDRALWAEVRKLSTLSGKSASWVSEAGIKLILMVAKIGVPNDLGVLLAKHDPMLLKALRDLHEAWRDA